MDLAATMELGGKRGFVERRAGNRHISVFRVGRLVANGFDQLCVVRNISSGGVMIEANHPPQVDDHVQVELRSDRSLAAVVRWVHGRDAGVQFDVPIDVAAMLREDRPSILRTQPRAPRFRRQGAARIIGTRHSGEGRLHNISINGVAIELPETFARDEPVTVAIDGLGLAHAHVRWSGHGETGLRLDKPLSYRALADWLDDRRGITID
jgi:hypothetical protein